ncbi:hypothetical protein CIK05_10935 [Bdellovibrio sp. qaytius]|nr:hypothetical protein CIK05_10935 [Bdellovibrio sp. qaytius]
MKSKLLALAIGILAASQMTFAQEAAPGIVKAKAAELTAHRVDRLVSLNKIDSSFLTKAAKMEVTVVQNQAPAYYKVRVSQTQPASGEALQMDVVYDGNGKPLSYTVLPGGSAGPDEGWTGVDAITLMENGLHYVLENGEKDANVRPFYTALTTITLTKGQLNGKTIARTQMKSSENALTLNVYVNLDGSFVSSEIIK